MARPLRAAQLQPLSCQPSDDPLTCPRGCFAAAGGSKVANVGPHEKEFPRYRLPAIDPQQARGLVGAVALVAALLLLIAAIAASTALAVLGAIVVLLTMIGALGTHVRSAILRRPWRPGRCSRASQCCCSFSPDIARAVAPHRWTGSDSRSFFRKSCAQAFGA
ncbi:MAG: DoxX family protein [Actinomycetota bacterium]|nr:DoxX family protein [Actinomycetota bacterium]